MLENTAKQCIPSLELGDLSERKMQAVSRIHAVFLTTKNSHKVEPGEVYTPPLTPNDFRPFREREPDALFSLTRDSQHKKSPRTQGSRAFLTIMSVEMEVVEPRPSGPSRTEAEHPES